MWGGRHGDGTYQIHKLLLHCFRRYACLGEMAYTMVRQGGRQSGLGNSFVRPFFRVMLTLSFVTTTINLFCSPAMIAARCREIDQAHCMLV